MRITSADIESKAAEFAISPIEVEKDYVFGWLLKTIYERPALAERLVLKAASHSKGLFARYALLERPGLLVADELDQDFVARGFAPSVTR